MSTSEFEGLLKEVVNAKRLSASKMTNLTDLAMKNMEHDTSLVSIMYRTHKTLSSTTAKVFSLYIFDALSRAAKHHSTKNGLSGDAFTHPGNSASFLSKIGGVVEGLFQDLVTSGSPEAKEKTKKILDIWIKGNTFPPVILSQLADILKDTQKVPETPIPAMPAVESQSTTTVDPRAAPTIPSPPATAPITPLQGLDQHAALLALLTQAAASSANPPSQQVPTPDAISPPQLDAAQLAVIQQLAHTAASVPSVPQYLPPPDLVNVQKFPSSSGVNGSSHSLPSYPNEPRLMVNTKQRHDGYHSPGSEPHPNPHFDERDNMRGRYRANFRNRGRGERFGRAWDPRDRDHHRADRDQSPVRSGRGGRSRSRSPGRSSRYNGRKESRYPSPQRPSVVSPTRRNNEPAKDEFGRDIRPESPRSPPSVKPRSPSPVAHVPKSPIPAEQPNNSRAPLAATTNHETSHGSNPVSSLLVNANTSSAQPPSTPLVTNIKEMGMENFDPTTFNFTSPADWEALGKMWQVTNGYLPSTEELMQFVMTSAIGQAMPGSSTSSQDFQPHSFTSGAGRGRGRGRGGFPEGRAAYGNGRNMHSEGGSVYGYANQTQNTDAIVLGEGTPLNREIPHTSSNGKEQWDESSNHGSIDASSNSAGGRMQRIGDKWVFVRATAATTMDVGS